MRVHSTHPYSTFDSRTHLQLAQMLCQPEQHDLQRNHLGCLLHGNVDAPHGMHEENKPFLPVVPGEQGSSFSWNQWNVAEVHFFAIHS